VARDERHKNKLVALLMENAVIHQYSIVIDTAMHYNVVILINTTYPLQLTSVENYFKHLRTHIKKVPPSSRQAPIESSSPKR
jgi:hypothetical protein